MANVGRGPVGSTLIGQGNGASPTFASIGTGSGLTAHGVLIGEGLNAFSAVAPSPTSGAVFIGKGAVADPAYSSTTTINDSIALLLVEASFENGGPQIALLNTGTGTEATARMVISTSSSASNSDTYILYGGNFEVGYQQSSSSFIVQYGVANTSPQMDGATAFAISNTGVPSFPASPLGVASGGTGRTTLTNHGILIGAATSALNAVSPSSTVGAVFIGAGSSADPIYSTTTSVSDAGGNLSVSSSQSGGTNGVIVTNSSNTASSNAYVSVSTAGTSAGNALVQLSNTADTVWSVWTPSTTNGSFHITPGNPGATDVMTASHSGNVDFPTSISLAGGTALSNYTEGTWTPTLIGGSTAGTTTYTAQNGYYTRIGNMVTVWAIIVTTGSSGTGSITFGGLPFTIKNQTNNFPPAVVFSNNAFVWPVGTTSLVVQGQLNSQTAVLFGNGSATAAAAAQIANVAYNFQYTLTYQV